MRPDGGGYGGKIAIVPETLTKAAGKLKPASQELNLVMQSLGGIAVPSMPGDVEPVVMNALAEASLSLGTEPGQIDREVVELTRRAWWAEYANAGGDAYTLTGTALAEFKAWMKDGTLLQYADEDQAEFAGKELGLVYSGFRQDPQQLIDLAATLKACENDGTGADIQRAFGAGFVNQFGASNMEAVPRVIQAMEWDRAIAFGNYMPPNTFLARDVAVKWLESDRSLHQNPVDDLLLPFSMLLANATYSNRLNTKVTDQIADSGDTWATAALISHGKFNTPFLKECFQTGVVDKIVQESQDARMFGHMDPPEFALGQMWSHGTEELPFDTKQIVLDALARNPEAAAQVLTDNCFHVQVYNQYGQQVDVRSPLQLIYEYGRFQDHGASFGNAYVAATSQLNGDVNGGREPFAGARLEGTQLTKTALDEMLGSDHGGMSVFKTGLATDLVRHHVGQLYDSAMLNLGGQGDGVRIQGAQAVPNALVPPGSLELSRDALINTIDHLSQNNDAFRVFTHGAAAYQAAVIDVNTAQLPSDQHPAWATRIGRFDAALMNGGDLSRVDDFDKASARHQIIADFFKDAAGGVLSLDAPVADAAVHTGVGVAIDSVYPAPDPLTVDWQNFDAHQDMQNSLQASITAGYYKHGLITLTPPSDIVPHGKLTSFDHWASGSDQQANWSAWMQQDDVAKVTGAAYSTAQQEISAHVAGFAP